MYIHRYVYTQTPMRAGQEPDWKNQLPVQLQHTATHCNTLQHTRTTAGGAGAESMSSPCMATSAPPTGLLQCVEVCCSVLQCVAVSCFRLATDLLVNIPKQSAL